MEVRALVVCVLGLGVGAGAGAQEPPAPALSMTVQEGRITCSVRMTSLSQVLDALAERTGVTFVAAGAVRGEDVWLEMTNVPVEQGVRRLLRSYDTFFYYSASGDAAPSLRAVWIYPRGGGAALRPVPHESTVTADDRRRIADADARVREEAYAELLSRTDEASREIVTSALRGASEADQGVRERLLTHALNQGAELPRDLLTELVRTDASAMIRLLALDALTGDPAAVEAASVAATDPSPMVRERALQILETQPANRRP